MASRSPACALQSPWLPEYHLDSTCDRVVHNSPEQRARRLAEYQKVLFEQQQQQQQLQKEEGATTTTRAISTTISSSNNNKNNNDSANHLQHPMEATITCPNTNGELQDLRRTHKNDSIRFFSWGLPTKWIVKNTATTPVVVALVSTSNSSFTTKTHHPRNTQQQQQQQQHLVSAAHPNLQDPPQQDPDSILQPGEWRAFDVLEGQVYHVYRVMMHEKKPPSLGQLLLQHRVGLISVSNLNDNKKNNDENNNNNQVYHKPEWAQFCKNAASDKRSNMKTSSTSSSSTVDAPPPTTATTNDNTRSFPLIMLNNHHERCNLLYRGFRNDIACDVDVYYVRSKGPGEPCVEVKKFHLSGSHDDDDDESSRSSAPATTWMNGDDYDHSSRSIHYEAALVDSTFVVRLTQHPDVVVNTITIQPTRITDCNSSPAITDSSSTIPVVDRSNALRQHQKQQEQQGRNQTAPRSKQRDHHHSDAALFNYSTVEFRWKSILLLPPPNVTTRTQPNTYDYFTPSS